MKKMIEIGLLVVSVLIVLVIVALFLHSDERNEYKKRGTYLIDKIETFRQSEHRLPNSFEELGLEEPMSVGPYYEKIDSVNYVVFFAIGFDETLIYYSDKKEWKEQLSIPPNTTRQLPVARGPC